MVNPKIVKKITVNQKELEGIYTKNKQQILSRKTASYLEDMMTKTVEIGTARGSFRRFKRKIKEKLIIGGKTGSITGGEPFGKRDWFTAFAKPNNNKLDKGISIAVMNINKDLWRVKAAYLAKNIIEYYYTRSKNLGIDKDKEIAKK